MFEMSSFRDSGVVLESCTTQKWEASSANSLATDINTSGKSSKYPKRQWS